MHTRSTPLAAVARGVAAGVVGTALMTANQELYAKLQPAPESPEEEPKDPWDEAPMPAQVGKRISEGLFHKSVSPDQIPLLTNVMHWAYGTGWGAAYGLVGGSLAASRPVRHGLLFGAGVMAMSYVQLVPMGIYQAPWKYSPADLAPELAFHLVYGVGVASGFRAAEAVA